jgi:hypothetical protein
VEAVKKDSAVLPVFKRHEIMMEWIREKEEQKAW